MEVKKNKIKNKTRTEYRRFIISILYQYELQNLIVNLKDVNNKFNLSKQEYKTINFISKRYNFLKSFIIKFLARKEATWINTKPIIRSILIFGVFELLYLDKKIVINEFVELTKLYTLEEKENDYKFVNAVLDKISQLFKGNQEYDTN
ncbi:transcription antitermination factor NusB [[Mycoplasma] collis]|uniref:transcription antitermination factor NusB n=1 Tax=[Mycoplasma] collis TaxID=2127 RepID=UPI00068E8C14|nr:transcription antitermination factor NusB [[Mycoplasma] collis]